MSKWPRNGGRKGDVEKTPLIGRFRSFSKKQLLELDGNSRSRSHREAQLLEILASPPNATVQRKDILEKIWSNDSFFNSRNLDIYIRHLRSHLPDDEQVQLITLKGMRYQWVW